MAALSHVRGLRGLPSHFLRAIRPPWARNESSITAWRFLRNFSTKESTWTQLGVSGGMEEALKAN
eukprot:1391143-Amorphochlora_amoeboformis.AAC.1